MGACRVVPGQGGIVTATDADALGASDGGSVAGALLALGWALGPGSGAADGALGPSLGATDRALGGITPCAMDGVGWGEQAAPSKAAVAVARESSPSCSP